MKGSAGQALHQIVDRRDDDGAPFDAVVEHADVAEIGAAHVLGRGRDALLHDMHEGAARVSRAERLVEIGGARLARHPHIAGAELAARHGRKMGREVDGEAGARGDAQFLFDLGHVAVIADAVRREPLARFREQDILLQAAAGAGDARLRIDDDVRRVDQLRFHERQKREQHRGRIAAGTGYEPRSGDFVAIVLGQAVDRVFQQRGRAVLIAIPLGIGAGIAQAKIGRHVDDLDALRELADLAMRRAMRKPAKDDVDLLPVGFLGTHKRGQSQACEMREDLGEDLAGMPLGDQRGDPNCGMQRREPDHVGAGIAGGAEHGGSDGFGVGHGGGLKRR